MKKKTFLLSVICLLFVVCFALTGCGKKDNDDNNQPLPQEYAIEFIVDNQTYSTIKSKGNETITLPTNPTKDKLIFVGWFFDFNMWQQEFTSDYYKNTPLTNDIKVYAKWNSKNNDTQATFNGFTKIDESNYNISLSNDTTILNLSDIVNVNESSTWTLCTDIYANNTITSKIAPLEIGNNTYYVLVTAENEDVKLYTLTIRRRPLYLVSFNTSGGTEIDGQNVEENSLAETPQTPLKTGYTFSNWDYDLNNPITQNITISANYSANTYKIKYHYDTNVIEQNVIFDSSITLKSNTVFSKNAYDLTSWNTSENGTGKTYNCSEQINEYKIDNDLDLYATWTPINYNINYHLFDGTNGNNLNAYTIETETFNLISAEKKGYRFDGWFSDNNFENQITQIERGSFGDLNLYAKFTKVIYSITYHLDEGTTDNPLTYSINDSDIALTNPTKSGYTFIGWYLEETFENKINSIQSGSCKDIELWAKWTIYAGGDGTELSPYLLSKPEHLNLLSTLTNSTENYSLNKYFEITNDIDFADCDTFTPIGGFESDYAFKGNFNGNNYNISNLTIFSFDMNGLFRYASNATISNIIISNCNINLSDFKYTSLKSGGIVGVLSNSTLKNCHVINGQTNINFRYNENFYCYLGLLIGKASSSNIENCSATGHLGINYNNVYAYYRNSYYGGLIGYIGNSNVKMCNANVEITKEDDTNKIGYETIYVGGLIGGGYGENVNSSLVENCYSFGKIKLKNEEIENSLLSSSILNVDSLQFSYIVGGLIGQSSSITITNCYTNENIDLYSYITADSTIYNSYSFNMIAGDIIGTGSGNKITNTLSIGDISVYNVVQGIKYADVIENTTASLSINGTYYFNENNFSAHADPSTETITITATECTLENLNDETFYINTLLWSEDVWDLSNIDISNNMFPTFKNI